MNSKLARATAGFLIFAAGVALAQLPEPGQSSSGPGGGSGTVTSVALTLPGIFNVSGSPVTTSGTLAATLANQSANTFLVGPTSGGAAAPTYRLMIKTDTPATTVHTDQANTFGSGLKQVFTASATTAGANVACAALPSTPANGDIACDSGDSNKLKLRSNGAWVNPGDGSGTVAGTTGLLAAFTAPTTVGDATAGLGISVVGGVVSGDSTVDLYYSKGAGAPTAPTCAQAQEIYLDQTNFVYYGCAETNRWARLGEFIAVANAASTGTTLNTLTKLTGAPSTAVIAGTSDTGGALGITMAGAGTTGTAFIATAGKTLCVFDAATTAGNYVQIDDSTAGNCKDAGSTYPTSGQVIGRVLSTNGSGGTYLISLGAEVRGTSVSGTQSANTIYSGPTSGGAANPSFRTLVAADLPAATDSAQGAAELAIASEVTTGSDTVRAVTPNALRGSDYGKRGFAVECVADATALSTGDGKCYIGPLPSIYNGWNVVEVVIGVGAAVSSSGAATFDIDRCGVVATGIRCSGTNVSIFSTLPTIDSNEDSTSTAATPAVINTSNDDLATDQWLRVNIDGAGTGTQGLYVWVFMQKP